MEDMLEKLQAVMSDPEQMQQIQALAKMLETDAENQSASDAAERENESSSAEDAAGGFDMGRLLQLSRLMKMGDGQQDADAALLLALRPHLKQERQKKLDQALKLLRMYTVYKTLQESGLLKDLF